MADQTNFEIADIIVMELVNEKDFMERIQPYVKATVDNYPQIRRLEKQIIKFCANSICCANHTHELARQNDYVGKIVTIEVLKHYWEQYSDEEFRPTAHLPGTDYYQTYKKKPKPTAGTNRAKLEIRVLTQHLPDANKAREHAHKAKHEPKQLTNPKPKTMEITVNKIETKTFINGSDAATLSDDQIFLLIARTEKDIEKLEAIKEKPKKLTIKITAMKNSVLELIKIVDSRD